MAQAMVDAAVQKICGINSGKTSGELALEWFEFGRSYQALQANLANLQVPVSAFLLQQGEVENLKEAIREMVHIRKTITFCGSVERSGGGKEEPDIEEAKRALKAAQKRYEDAKSITRWKLEEC